MKTLFFERKKHEILGRIGRSQPHLKPSEGFCVIVSTDKYALKAAKKSEENESERDEPTER